MIRILFGLSLIAIPLWIHLTYVFPGIWAGYRGVLAVILITVMSLAHLACLTKGIALTLGQDKEKGGAQSLPWPELVLTVMATAVAEFMLWKLMMAWAVILVLPLFVILLINITHRFQRERPVVFQARVKGALWIAGAYVILGGFSMAHFHVDLPGIWIGPNGLLAGLSWSLFWLSGLGLLITGIAKIIKEARQEKQNRRLANRRGGEGFSSISRGLLASALLTFLTVMLLASQNEVQLIRSDWPPAEDTFYLPQKEALKVMSLGYSEALADLLWIKTVAYFGYHLNSDHKYDWLEKYLETIIHLDPKFRRIYEWAGVVSMYNMRRITAKSIMTSLKFLKEGYRHFPNYWRFPFMICTNYYFELYWRIKDPSLRRKYREIGAEYCQEASQIKGALSYLPTMTGTILSKMGKHMLARQHLRLMIMQTQDKKLREQIKKRYAALVSDVAAERVTRQSEAFFASHKANFPFVPIDFFALLGTKSSMVALPYEIKVLLDNP